MKEYLIIDIETGDALGASLDIEKRYVRKGNTRDADKVSRKQDELKAGCLDMSPVSMVGLKSSERQRPVVLIPGGAKVEGVDVIACGGECDLFYKLSEVLSEVPLTVEIVSFAGYGFDLPKLRLGFCRYGLRVPSCLTVNKHFDIQYEMKKYLVKNYAFASLEESCAKMGIEFKKSIQGCEINDYIQSRRLDELIAYNISDLWATEQLYHKLKGVV